MYLKRLSKGSKECIHNGKKSQFVKKLGNLCGILTCATFRTMAPKKIINAGVITLKKMTLPAKDKPKTIAGTTKNIFVK